MSYADGVDIEEKLDTLAKESRSDWNGSITK